MNPFEESLLKYYTHDQLNSIQSLKVGIAGAGGLGSNVAIILARSGVKHFEILDFDHVELSNLNRQHYFSCDITKDKVTSLNKHLLNINPDIQTTSHTIKWESNNANKFFKECDCIVEAFDHPSSKKLIIEFYQDKCKYLVSGNGMAGLKRKTPITVQTINNIYIVGDNTSDTQKGLPPLAPRVITCAAMMAEIIVDLAISNS